MSDLGVNKKNYGRFFGRIFLLEFFVILLLVTSQWKAFSLANLKVKVMLFIVSEFKLIIIL